MNDYEQHLIPPTPRPLELLHDVMAAHISCCTPEELDATSDPTGIAGLDREEVRQEILTIWLPIFKFRSSLTIALNSMQISHPAQIESDIRSLYLDVLKDLEL
jgi:hypothetical protein